MKLKSIKELDVADKPVLVRTGFDVPHEQGKLGSDFRLKSALPTLKLLVGQKAKLVIISHLGRPQKEGLAWNERLSLLPAARRLGELWERKMVVVEPGEDKLPQYDIPHLYFFPQNIETDNIGGLLEQMKPGDAAMLENLRFYEGEEKDDKDFAQLLAGFGSAYVNEAFSVSHRKNASIHALAQLLPAAAGLNLQQEVDALDRVMSSPKKPMVVMMGGIKLSTKVGALKNLAKKADKILLGGGLANLLFLAQGYEIGKSKVVESETELAKQILRDFRSKLVLPRDVVVSHELDGPAESVPATEVKPHQFILDIGPDAIFQFSEFLRSGQTLVWNGPMGYFEQKQFSHGTYALARFFASRTKGRAFGVAGGGETLAVIEKENLFDDIDHVSTGGGAMLDYLAGSSLPGIELLRTD